MLRKIALCFLSLLQLSSGTVKDCSSTSHTGHISVLTINPPAPASGQWITVHIEYTLDKTVTSGKATYTASFNGFPLNPTTNDLCTDMEPTTTPCPITSGLVVFEGISQIGDGSIHGTLVASTTWTDQDGSEILCWGFTVRI